jgi:hypothetical protein
MHDQPCSALQYSYFYNITIAKRNKAVTTESNQKLSASYFGSLNVLIAFGEYKYLVLA